MMRAARWMRQKSVPTFFAGVAKKPLSSRIVSQYIGQPSPRNGMPPR
jgi:hypothetical protein